MSDELTEWDEVIRKIVLKIRELKSEEAPAEEGSKGFLALKVLGCNFDTVESSEGNEYLRVRWFGGGKTGEIRPGQVDRWMRKSLKRADLYLEATSSS